MLLVMMMSSLFLVASRVVWDDDDGLTRPGAKRVRLWRDRPLEGAFPSVPKSGFCPLCRKAPKIPKTCCSQTTEKSLTLFMAPIVSIESSKVSMEGTKVTQR